MKKLLTTLTIAIAALSAQAAMLPEAKFRRLDTRDGLSSSQVNCVFRDSRGFVWIGTSYGLNRYDGYRFKTYYSNNRDTTTIRDNYITQIYEAFDGKLWIQLGMDYCVYDPVTESFERNASRELAKLGIEGGIERFYIDSKKNFWVKLYDQGMTFYNPYTKHRHEFKMGYGPQELSPDWGISHFTDMGSSVVYTSYNGEMACMDGEKGHVSWKNSWMKRHGGLHNQEYRISIDRQGNIWVANLSNLFCYIQKHKRWYTSLPELLRAYDIDDFPYDKLITWRVMPDRKGLLWVATDHEGLFAVDLKNRHFRQFKHEKFDPTTVSDNTLKNIYQDYDGQIWIGTDKNGVNQYRKSASYAHYAELGDVNTATEDLYGNLWIGTNDRGIIVYNPKTGEQMQHYTPQNSGLAGNVVIGSITADDGSIWMGSYNGGLTHCIPTGNKASGEAVIVNYSATGKPGDLANSSVWGLTEDKWHRIWVALLGGGVQMLDPRTGHFTTWNTANSQLPSNYLSSAGWNSKGWLMVGTSYFYSIINPVTGRLINRPFPNAKELSSAVTNSICVMEDSRGLVWQGSTAGLCIYDPLTKNVERLDMTNGLFDSGVTSIIEDGDHVMWVVTNHGVSRIIPKKENGTWLFTIRNFNERDGLQPGTYNQRSASLLHDGTIIVGGQAGLDFIYPRLISSKTSKERPVFSGLLVFDQEVDAGREVEGRVIIKKALSLCDRLKLRYSENNFTIQLGSDAGYASNDKRFIYKLEGFRDTWNKTVENNPNISFMSLRYGDYKLRVRMLNDDGTMGEQEAVLDITITEPLWRTRWALLLYVLTVAGLALWWRRVFLRHQAERLKIEQLRRDTEKVQWMHEMQAKMQAKKNAEIEKEEKHKELQSEQETVLESGHEGTATEGAGKETGGSVRTDTFVPTSADLVAYVRGFCRKYRMPPERRLRLQFLPLVDTLTIEFDPILLAHALNILVDNSVNFSPSDSRIKIMLDNIGGQAEIRVADNGLGIPEDAKPYIFTPPVANDSSIGLYEVKRIVEKHGGSIRADDNTPTGTVFFITIPIS